MKALISEIGDSNDVIRGLILEIARKIFEISAFTLE